jgi:hypothetical protein
MRLTYSEIESDPNVLNGSVAVKPSLVAKLTVTVCVLSVFFALASADLQNCL